MNSDYILQVIVTNLAEIILLYENYGFVCEEIEKERENRKKSERNEKSPF